MRLIDADAFEDFTREHCTDDFADLWCELIRRQPTLEFKEQIVKDFNDNKDTIEPLYNQPVEIITLKKATEIINCFLS